MRVVVFFDLPMVDTRDRKAYSEFRRFLIKEGFIMMQQSVYTKLALNHSVSTAITERVKKKTPKKGLVQVLIITEKQYASIDYLIGEAQKVKNESSERLVIL